MTCSTVVVLESLASDQGSSSLEKLDQTLNEMVKKTDSDKKWDIFMPQMFFYLSRKNASTSKQGLKVVTASLCEQIPDAKAKEFKGDDRQLAHVPFLDHSCISEKYIERVS